MGFTNRVHIGLDYFDASINRIAAWTIGTRNMLRALLFALLEPTAKLRAAESAGDYTSPAGVAGGNQVAAVRRGVGLLLRIKRAFPSGEAWLAEVKRYEKEVLST